MIINLPYRIDRSFIAAATSLEVSLGQAYSYALSPENVIDIIGLGSTEKEAYCKAIDAASWLFEENAYIWKINYDSKVFNLEDSYIRDAESTEAPLTPLPNEAPLIVVFEIPGFEAGKTRELSLWYNEDFVAGELDVIRDELGIVVTGNGAEFTIANDVDCKVYFVKPDGVTEVYVIDNVQNNQIIEP